MVSYEKEEPVPRVPAEEIIKVIREEGPMKPWTLLSKIENDTDSIRTEVLKPLVIKGVLSINADGNIILYKPKRLEKITK